MRLLIAVSLAFLPVVGCQTYAPVPLQEEAVLAAWRERSLTLPLVRDFATRQLPTTRISPVFDMSDGVMLAEAECLALLFNPSLRTSRLAAAVARVGSAEAGRWEDPRLGIDAERIISGTDNPWIVGGLLNLTIPVSGRLSIEKRLAASAADVELLKVLDQERSVVAELRSRWADWSASKMRAEVIEQTISDLTVITAALSKLQGAGEIDPTEARLFEIDSVRRKGQLIAARRDTARLEAELQELMGLSPATPLKLIPSFSVVTVNAEATSTRHVKVQIARAEYTVAENALELEIRKQYPDLDLGGGFGTDEGESRVLGGISGPIPLLNGNRRAISEAFARRDAMRAAFEQELIAVESAIARLSNDTNAASEHLMQIENLLIPLVDRQLSESRRLLEIGEFNPLMLREAIDSAADAKLEILAARLSLSKAEAAQAYWTELAESIPATGEKP